MISIERNFSTWKKSSEPPFWTTETVWLNPDYVVSIEVIHKDTEPDAFRGTEFTKVHTTKTHYITTEPADELAHRLK